MEATNTMDTATGILKDQKGITIVSQNIRGLASSFDDQKILLQRSNVDLFAMQETFLSVDNPVVHFDIEGYSLGLCQPLTDCLVTHILYQLKYIPIIPA